MVAQQLSRQIFSLWISMVGERCIWRRDSGVLCPPILTLHPSFCSPVLGSKIPPSSSLVASYKRAPLRDAVAPLPLRSALPSSTGKNCIFLLYERTSVVILRKCTHDKWPKRWPKLEKPNWPLGLLFWRMCLFFIKLILANVARIILIKINFVFLNG